MKKLFTFSLICLIFVGIINVAKANEYSFSDLTISPFSRGLTLTFSKTTGGNYGRTDLYLVGSTADNVTFEHASNGNLLCTYTVKEGSYAGNGYSSPAGSTVSITRYSTVWNGGSYTISGVTQY